jgi:hypothetical protein
MAKKKKASRPTTGSQLDIILAGPLLFVPAVNLGVVTGVEVFAPVNGHHLGAVFVPDVWFSDGELNEPECERWPASTSFSLLDSHSYSIDLTQRIGRKESSFLAADIPAANHKVKPGRRLSNDWEIAISIRGKLSDWSSHSLVQVTDGFYHGADVPTSAAIASLQKLTYTGVTAAEFCGASREPREYLRANIAKGGTLLIVGEIPYQPTLLHERRATDAIAKLAGLDLHLAALAPSSHRTRLMIHTPQTCGHSIIVAE